MTAPAVPARDVRRARIAVAALFLTNGALFANLIPRLPEIKADLGLSNSLYGLAIASMPTGAVVAGLSAGWIVRRFGSAATAAFGTTLVATGTVLAAASPSLPMFAVTLFLAGCADAVTDVGQNAHGLVVQKRYGRSIINGFHAVWSGGAVLGGGIAALALALEVPRVTHLMITSVFFCAVAFLAWRFCLPERPGHVGDDEVLHAVDPAAVTTAPSATTRRSRLMLAALVGIAVAGAMMEDAGSTWAAVYLSGPLGAAPSLAAAGFVALVAAQFVGRVLGDRMVDRFGHRAVARAGCALAAVGMGGALLLVSVPGTILGFAAIGVGTATLIPAAMHQADELPGLREGTGLTVVAWLMRVGFLAGPPLLGLIADATSIRVGLAIVPVVAVAVLFLSRALPSRPHG